MEKKTKIIHFELTPIEATVIMNTVGLMYCGGPEYYDYPKKLKKKEIREAMSCWEQLCCTRNTAVYGTDTFTVPIPYSEPVWQKKTTYKITQRELDLLLEIFDTTLKESKSDDFDELRIITGFPPEKIFHCFEILKQAMVENVIRNNVASHIK